MNEPASARREASPQLAARSALLLILICLTSCNSPPPRVVAPSFNPGKIAAGAIQEYDANGDGALAGDELSKAASIRSALSSYDADGDGRVTAEEIQKRMEKFAATKVGLMKFLCRVSLNGQPLQGATVTLRPEPFLKDVVQVASGVTDASGKVQLEIADDLLPASDRGLHAMQPGLYWVEITHPTISIPARYNTETTLGREVSGDSLVGVDVHFELSN
jgi:hypothetical protein